METTTLKNKKTLFTISIVVLIAIVGIMIFMLQPPSSKTGGGTAGDETLEVNTTSIPNAKTL